MDEEPVTIEIEVIWKKSKTTFKAQRKTFREANALVERYRESIVDPLVFQARIRGQGHFGVYTN